MYQRGQKVIKISRKQPVQHNFTLTAPSCRRNFFNCWVAANFYHKNDYTYVLPHRTRAVFKPFKHEIIRSQTNVFRKMWQQNQCWHPRGRNRKFARLKAKGTTRQLPRRLINYIDSKAKCLHLKQLTCKWTLRQVCIRVYRLEIQSVMLVSTQLCELLPL